MEKGAGQFSLPLFSFVGCTWRSSTPPRILEPHIRSATLCDWVPSAAAQIKLNTWKLLFWRDCCWSMSPSSQIVIVKSVDRPSLSSSLPISCRSYKHRLNPMIDWALGWTNLFLCFRFRSQCSACAFLWAKLGFMVFVLQIYRPKNVLLPPIWIFTL